MTGTALRQVVSHVKRSDLLREDDERLRVPEFAPRLHLGALLPTLRLSPRLNTSKPPEHAQRQENLPYQPFFIHHKTTQLPHHRSTHFHAPLTPSTHFRLSPRSRPSRMSVSMSSMPSWSSVGVDGDCARDGSFAWAAPSGTVRCSVD